MPLHFTKWNTGIFWICTCLDRSLKYTWAEQKQTLFGEKKIFWGAQAFWWYFKHEVKTVRTRTGLSVNQPQHSKVISIQQPVQVTAFLFTLIRSLMKFYSISRVQTRSKFHREITQQYNHWLGWLYLRLFRVPRTIWIIGYTVFSILQLFAKWGSISPN